MADPTVAPPVSAPPAPDAPGAPILGSLPPLRHDPLGYFTDLQRDVGPVVRLRFGPREAYLVTHPDAAQRVFQDNHPNYHKSERYAYIEPLIGKGLITSDGAFWLRQRRFVQPVFHRRKIREYAEIMVRCADDTVTRWDAAEPGEPRDAAEEMMALTLRIIGFLLFSTDLERDAPQVAHSLEFALEHVNRRMEAIANLPAWLPTPDHLRFRSALEELEEVVQELIAERRARGAAEGGAGDLGDDLLGMLLAAQDDDSGARMTDAQVRDELMTLYLAGHETTANALAWTFRLLHENPDWYDRHLAEIDRVLGGRLPTAADYGAFETTRRIVQEALRLYPPAWGVGRQTLADDVLCGVRVPADRPMIVAIYHIHRHPDFWPEPERFDPDRFLPERAGERHRFAYVPFAAGPRQCIGKDFALMEAVLLLATIGRRFRLELEPGHPVEPEPSITLRPRHGLKVRLVSR